MASIAYWNGSKWVLIASGSGGGGVIVPGPKGDKGDKGDDGKSITVTKSQIQPANAALGDVWLEEAP